MYAEINFNRVIIKNFTKKLGPKMVCKGAEIKRQKIYGDVHKV